MNGPVILIDDERAMRDSLGQWLELAGHPVSCHADGRAALERLDAHWPGVVVTDLRMASLDGLGVLDAVKCCDADIPVVLITGHGDVDSAVEAMRRGAYDFIEKPFQPERLGSSVARALEKRALVLQNRRLAQRLGDGAALEQRLMGDSALMRRVRQDIVNFAAVDVDVLLVGETGTGKEVMARCLHDLGSRCAAPFRAIDCSAIAPDRVEASLFGDAHPDALSGAPPTASPFELADGGSLLLDEIVDMPAAHQVKLLRVLEQREVQRVGEQRLRRFDVRLISAADERLPDALTAGTFRRELYFRLNTIELSVPPLRDRGEDALQLFDHFVDAAAQRFARERPPTRTADATALLSHSWPGNVRELRAIAERFVLYGDASVAELLAGEPVVARRPGLAHEVAAFEKALIERALLRANGDVNAASDALGVPRRTLGDKLARHGIERARFTVSDS